VAARHHDILAYKAHDIASNLYTLFVINTTTYVFPMKTVISIHQAIELAMKAAILKETQSKLRTSNFSESLVAIQTNPLLSGLKQRMFLTGTENRLRELNNCRNSHQHNGAKMEKFRTGRLHFVDLVRDSLTTLLRLLSECNVDVSELVLVLSQFAGVNWP